MSGSATVPGEACYWGILETPAHTPSAIAFAFEGVLPFAVDTLHCASTRLPDGRILVAGVPHIDMRRLLDAPETRQAWSVRPGPPPGFIIADSAIAAHHEHIELLSGAYEPAGRRLRRRIALAMWLFCCGVSAAILIAGSVRRHYAAHSIESDLRAAEYATIDAVVPPSGSNRNLPPQARLLQAHRMHAGRNTKDRPHDVLLLLDRVWAAIPHEPGLTVLEATADQRRVLVRTSSKDPSFVDKVTEAAASISAGTGSWHLEPPDLSPGREQAASTVFTWTRRADSQEHRR